MQMNPKFIAAKKGVSSFYLKKPHENLFIDLNKCSGHQFTLKKIQLISSNVKCKAWLIHNLYQTWTCEYVTMLNCTNNLNYN